MRAQPERRVRLYLYKHPDHGVWQGFLTTDGYFIAAEPLRDDTECLAMSGRRAFLASRGTVWDIDGEYEALLPTV